MVTLSVTPTRIAAVLVAASDTVLAVDGWDADLNPVMRHLEAAADTGSDVQTPLEAYDALSTHLRCPAGTWERMVGRTQADVHDALREAARAVSS